MALLPQEETLALSYPFHEVHPSSTYLTLCTGEKIINICYMCTTNAYGGKQVSPGTYTAPLSVTKHILKVPVFSLEA